MVNRILRLAHFISADMPWYIDGVILESGQRVGALGWKASYGNGKWQATAPTIEAAVQELLLNVERAFAIDIKEKENHLEYMKQFKE